MSDYATYYDLPEAVDHADDLALDYGSENVQVVKRNPR